MNIVLAFVLFSLCFMIGAPQSVDTGGKIQITETVKGSPAASAGILSGDTISSIDGQTLANVPDVQNYISTKGGSDISLNIIRDGKPLTINIKPELKDGKGLVGIALDQVDTVRYPFFQSIWEGLKQTAVLLWLIIVAFFGLIKNLIMGVGAGDAVGGPIRIAQMTGEVARFGIVNLLNFTAILSLNLAVINFLPFPALDGGRIFFLILEKIKGKPVKRETEALIHNIGFLILIGLIILVTYKDIARMFIK
jgi:regulator of sigma E protease